MNSVLRVLALPLVIGLSGLLLPAAGFSALDTPLDDPLPEPVMLESNPRHKLVSRRVLWFAERAHYEKLRVDDSLSAEILNTYIESLDSNKHYFTRGDIDYIRRYDELLDDTLRSGDMTRVFDIFGRYRQRTNENLGFALEQLREEPDYSVVERYTFDREELDWAADEQELRDIWRKRVKNDLLSLKLAGKEFSESQDILAKRYRRVLKRVNEFDSDEVFAGFMNAFARTLDPHSSYMSPRQSEEYRIQMSLSYQGIGASLQIEDDYVKVMNIIPGGPAAIDGRLAPDDRILGVAQGSEEMVDVVGWQLDDVVQLIRGASGTEVKLNILPANSMPGSNQYVLDLTRDKIKLEEQAAKGSSIDIERGGQTYKMGVIEVPSFYQDFDARSRGDKDFTSTTRDVSRIIDELEAEGVDGIVMDLRGNGGGHLSEATSLSGLFINTGPVVQLRDNAGRIEVLDDPNPSSKYDGPLVVLVDRYSASASEIFAGAIQDYNRGIVVGQQTFGKGTVQNLYVLDQYSTVKSDPGLGQLTLTIGKYYRVTGDSTQNRGVLPDIDLPSAVDKSRVGESSRPRALPWDQIRTARYQPGEPLESTIVIATDEQRVRMEGDPDIDFLLEDIEAIGEIRQQNSVALDLETRQREQDERKAAALDRENSRRAAVGAEPVASLEVLEEEERPDILLDQAAQILLDLGVLSGSTDAQLLTSTSSAASDES